MTWEYFRELFEDEYVAPLRPETHKVYANVFNLFEGLCSPKQLRGISERTVSAFAAALRKEPGNGNDSMAPSSIKVRLQFLKTALNWAARQIFIREAPRFPVVKTPDTDPLPIAAESFERLLNKAAGDASMKAFLLCGWLAGLRLSEAAALQREPSQDRPWIDLARDRIILTAQGLLLPCRVGQKR
ncbi:MAG TPA: hypothetical protein VH682_13690 [Gemmataceae bacterium]|jgi:integrase